jgi:hypothetical protein
MEENSTFNAESPNKMHIDQNAKAYLLETAKWAKFLSIMGFIGMGLIVIMGFFMGSIMGNYASLMGFGDGGEGLLLSSFSLIYILVAALYIYPLWKLYQFADLSKRALVTNDSTLLTNALEAQKSMFKFMGIWVLVVLAIYAILLVIALVSFLFLGAKM